MADPRTLVITHPDCLQHAKPGHPECPARLKSIMAAINAHPSTSAIEQRLAPAATDSQLSRVHPLSLIDQLTALEPVKGTQMADPDTYLSRGSLHAARLAAGACLEATQLVLSGEKDRVFCAVRPPGHHAEIDAAMGFCLFNNVALGAVAALAHPSGERVAILDFDVHHCNGTVDIFKEDDRVLVCSSFQADYYPHRYLDYENAHIVATPLAAGTRSLEFRQLIEQQWPAAINQHQPDLIFISAGFDAHKDDPLAQLELEVDDYRWITQLIVDLAKMHCNGRIISTLEGGYQLEALGECARMHLETLLQP